MWKIKKSFSFEASHVLPDHDGKCSRLHGHSWKGEVCVSSIALHTDGPKHGMVMDYGDISKVVDAVVEEKLDHYHLNDTLPVATPTSEMIARWLFEELSSKIAGLHSVTIHETCTSSCEYSP